MAELVDAHASGACGGDTVEVRVLLSAQKHALACFFVDKADH